MEQADKVAVLTGPVRGTGNAIVVALAGAGATVVCPDRPTNEIESLAKELSGLAVTCDVNEKGTIQKLMQKMLDTYARIEILVKTANALAFPPPSSRSHTLLICGDSQWLAATRNK